MTKVVDFFTSSYLTCYVTIILGIFLFFLISLIFFRKKKYLIAIYLLITTGFGILGLTIGLLVGASREPAVNTVITSLLTFLGAFTTYILSKSTKAPSDTPQKNFKDVSFLSSLICLIVLPLALFYGVYVSSDKRGALEDYDKDLEYYNTSRLKKFEYDLNVARDSIQHYLNIAK